METKVSSFEVDNTNSIQNIKERIIFSKQHKDYTYRDQIQTLFSYEKKFNLEGSYGNNKEWVFYNTKYEKRNFLEKSKFCGGFVMIWDVVTI